MSGFLYKDIKCLRDFWIFFSYIYGIFLALLIAFMVIVKEISMLSMLLPSICGIGLFMIGSFGSGLLFGDNDKMLWQCFAIATPGAMKAQIQAKYLVIILVNLTVSFSLLVMDTMVAIVRPENSGILSLFIVILFSWNLFKEAINLPFIYRFGAKYGKSIKLVILVLLLSILLVYGLFGDISFFLQDDVLAAIKKMIQGGLAIWVIALFPYVSGVLYYVSYRISLKVYRKGIEHYEG